MEWTESLKKAIDYMERNLLENIGADDVADEVYMSSFYLQKGFKIMTGYSISEYLRCRRLYLAALDVIADREKVIDLAYRYGYDTPESFTKAFSRFHGVSPMGMKNDAHRIKTFLPLKIKVMIQGGNSMDFTVEKMKGFKVIGFEREFSPEDAYQRIPGFWEEFCHKCRNVLQQPASAPKEVEEVVRDCRVGEFGICIEDVGQKDRFRYLIAGTYEGGPVPEGMTVYELPDLEWAKFRCVGPMPGALQAVNSQIFQEWLPGNPDYEVAMGVNIEWYAMGDTKAQDYESAIWLPVQRKQG